MVYTDASKEPHGFSIAAVAHFKGSFIDYAMLRRQDTDEDETSAIFMGSTRSETRNKSLNILTDSTRAIRTSLWA